VLRAMPARAGSWSVVPRSLVPEGGLEPPQCHHRRILKASQRVKIATNQHNQSLEGHTPGGMASRGGYKCATVPSGVWWRIQAVVHAAQRPTAGRSQACAFVLERTSLHRRPPSLGALGKSHPPMLTRSPMADKMESAGIDMVCMR